MKFAEHLSAHITPEWRKQYIAYEEMKVMLYSYITDERNETNCELNVFDDHFMNYCEKQLTKINTFFAEKLAEAMRKLANLKYELNECVIKESSVRLSVSNVVSNVVSNGASNGMKWKSLIDGKHTKHSKHSYRKLNDLKLAFSEFYLSLVLLQNYQNLNFTGFRKILKKHDKLMNTSSGIEWRKRNVDVSQFYTCGDVDKLIVETENLFINWLECGDRQRAMKRLRVPPLSAQQSLWQTFRCGLFAGAFLILFATVVLTAMFRHTDTHIEWHILLRLYRAPFLLIIFLFLIGVNVYGWRTSGVNHVLIFELDPRDHISEQHLFEIASIFAVLWSLSVLGYLFSVDLSIPCHVFPLVLVLVMITFLINPTPTLRHSARFWLLKVLMRVIKAPFVKVNFADFWLADQLNSLVPIILDFEYFLCYYFYLYTSPANKTGKVFDCIFSRNTDLMIRTIVACLPAWFRFAQCVRRYKDDSRGMFPHLINAGKYSTTFFVVIFSTLTKMSTNSYENALSNPYFILWITSMILSSCYTYIWDIRMDWGLFDFNNANKDYPFLREEIAYSSPNYYYFAMIEDLILRFGWTLSVSLTEIGAINGDIVVTILAPLELFRRFVWNFFRLENEHLNNCGEFRAVRDISIAPIPKRDATNNIDNDNDNDNDNNDKLKPNQILFNQNGGIFISIHNNDISRCQSMNSNAGEISLLLGDQSESNQF